MKIVSFYKVDYALTRAAVDIRNGSSAVFSPPPPPPPPPAFFRAALDSNAETEARKLAGTVYLD
jgi:hypothetical protein